MKRSALRVPNGVSHGSGLLSVLLLLALTGCGDVPPPESGGGPDASPPTPAMEAPGGIRASARLQPTNGSTVSGELTAMRAVEAIVIVLEAEGLPEPGEFRSEILRGSCREAGETLVVLNPVVGLSDGTGASTTLLEPEDLVLGEPFSVRIHGIGGVPLACGDLTAEIP
jgi:hypothetical protein